MILTYVIRRGAGLLFLRILFPGLYLAGLVGDLTGLLDKYVGQRIGQLPSSIDLLKDM